MEHTALTVGGCFLHVQEYLKLSYFTDTRITENGESGLPILYLALPSDDTDLKERKVGKLEKLQKWQSCTCHVRPDFSPD